MLPHPQYWPQKLFLVGGETSSPGSRAKRRVSCLHNLSLCAKWCCELKHRLACSVTGTCSFGYTVRKLFSEVHEDPLVIYYFNLHFMGSKAEAIVHTAAQFLWGENAL